MSFFDYPNETPAPPGDAGQLLADASEEEWATLLEHTRYRRFGPGDAVVTAGARDQSLYLVLEGQLEVLVDRGRRGHRRIASTWSGDCCSISGRAAGGIVLGNHPEVVAAVTAAVKNGAEVPPAPVAELRRGNWTGLKDAGRVSAPTGA